jgi:hypothetical protein
MRSSPPTAHELGHILTDKKDNGGHYREETPATRRIGQCNVMWLQPWTPDPGVTSGKRLWPQRDGDGFRQIDEIYRSPYIWKTGN